MPKRTPKFDNQKQPDEKVIRLAQRIKDLRIAKGYKSYEKFAVDKNIGRSQYWRYERGEDLRFSSLVKVAKALDMTLAEFFQGFNAD